MKKSANSLVRETRELLDEVLGEATVTLGSDTYFVPDYVVRDMFKSDKEWAKQATAKVKQRRPGDDATKYEPRVKAAVLPPSLAPSFVGMNEEIKRDLAVIYYENKEFLDDFIADKSARTELPGKLGSTTEGSWSTSTLPAQIVNKVYELETRGRTDVVGKGEALCLLRWSNGVPAGGGGAGTSTATVDLVFGGIGVSVKATGDISKPFSFKVNGTLNSFKKMAQDSLKASNVGAAVAKFSGLWSTSMSVAQIFEITKEQKATRDEFRALVDSINKAVREMEGSGAAGEYVYLVVSPTGWKSIPKKDEGFTFGGTTEGKVTVNYNMSSKLREAAELDTQQRFDAFIASNTASEGKAAANAENTAFEKYKGLADLPSLSGSEDAKSDTIKDIKAKIKDTINAIEKYNSALKKANDGGSTLRPNRQLALDAIQSGKCALLKSLKAAADTLQKIPKNPKKADDIERMIAAYNVHMNQIFGTAGTTGFLSPMNLSDDPEGQELFVNLLGPPRGAVSEGRRKPRRSEASMGGVPGPAVPLGRGPTGRPTQGTAKSILSRNARNQARYFGGGEEVDQTKLFSETRSLMEEFLGVNVLTPVPVSLVAGRPGRAGAMTDYQLMEVYFSRRRGLLNESHNWRAQLIMEGVLDGLLSLGKAAFNKGVDIAASVAKAGAEAAVEVAKDLGKDVKAIANGVKTVAGNVGDILTYIIMKLPGGEELLTFVKDYASKLGGFLKEALASVGEKLQGWAESTKKWFLSYLTDTILDKNPDLKAKVEEKLGIDDGVKSKAKEEMKAEGMRSVRDFNRVMEERDAARKGKGRIQSEAISSGAKKSALKAAATGGGTVTGTAAEGIGLATDTAKFLTALAESKPISPEDMARKFAASAVKRVLTVIMEVCSSDKGLYTRCIAPIWSSPIMAPFKTGYGLALASLAGIAASGGANLEVMTDYVKGIRKGMDSGANVLKAIALERGVGSTTETAKMFMANRGKLLLDLMLGLITGSNVEVIIRGFFDPSKVTSSVQRIVGLILNGIRAYMKENARQAIRDAAGGDLADEVEDGVASAMETAIDRTIGAMLPSNW